MQKYWRISLNINSSNWGRLRKSHLKNEVRSQLFYFQSKQWEWPSAKCGCSWCKPETEKKSEKLCSQIICWSGRATLIYLSPARRGGVPERYIALTHFSGRGEDTKYTRSSCSLFQLSMLDIMEKPSVHVGKFRWSLREVIRERCLFWIILLYVLYWYYVLYVHGSPLANETLVSLKRGKAHLHRQEPWQFLSLVNGLSKQSYLFTIFDTSQGDSVKGHGKKTKRGVREVNKENKSEMRTVRRHKRGWGSRPQLGRWSKRQETNEKMGD